MKEPVPVFSPRVLICRDCGEDYDFAPGEQAQFAKLGFKDPVRCPPCRQAARRKRESSAGSGKATG